MSSARLGKRPLPVEFGQDSYPGGSKVKLHRLERGPEDFSQMVKDKLQSYTRTGQACDRCRVRKIRCDGLPEGCSSCAQQNLECLVTDRVTGRTERRGYMQQLEREKKDMMTRLRDMEKLLEDRGIQVRPWQWTPPYGLSTASDPGKDPREDEWTSFLSLWVRYVNRSLERPYNGYCTTHQASSLQTADPRTADAHLGVTSRGAPSCSINGTQLSILGATDITPFNAPNVDGPLPSVPKSNLLIDRTFAQFATRPQHNRAMTEKQAGFGLVTSRRPSQSNGTTPSSTVNVTEQSSIYRAPGTENNPCHNHSMTASMAAYPQMGYADLTQSAISTPSSASSFLQSSCRRITVYSGIANFNTFEGRNRGNA